MLTYKLFIDIEVICVFFLEIVELVNGDIVLQRADGDGEPLMTIRFSDESKGYMPMAD